MRPFRHCLRTGAVALAFAVAAPAGFANAALVTSLDYGSGPRAVARAAVAGATVAELMDSPPLLAEPGSQNFVDGAFAELESLAPQAALRRRYAALRVQLRAGSAAAPAGASRFDRTRALQTLQTLTLDMLRALPPPQDRLFLLGTAAQQLDYNARVLREAQTDRDLRTLLATLGDGDDLFPGSAAARAKLAILAPEDWAQCAELAHRLVVAVLGSPDAAPFPAAPGVWTILVRTREAGSGAGKRDAVHLSLDVVWFDGRHATFAGYPDGGIDFAHDAARLECARDREPQSGTLRATPVEPPPGLSYDAVAASFERSCDALAKRPPPYSVDGVSDDRLIAAMLRAARIDPGAVNEPSIRLK